MTIDRRRALLAAGATALAPLARAKTPTQSVTIYKDPSCGCCGSWVDHLKRAGFTTTVDDSQDMAQIKTKLGVPADLTSCHTGVTGGYVIEGHVPAADIKKLLKTKPKAVGIAVPGMPANSPGMEAPGAPNERYTVWLFRKDGTRSAFAQHGA